MQPDRPSLIVDQCHVIASYAKVLTKTKVLCKYHLLRKKVLYFKITVLFIWKKVLLLKGSNKNLTESITLNRKFYLFKRKFYNKVL